ncbi:MAG: NERD domain-containing protein [Bacteroidetes bacterium]|nr:NERD domain-containing protein [Bacteroidota bacterium]
MAIAIIASIILVFVLLIYLEVRNKRLLQTVTNTNRGTNSERNLVLRLLKLGTPAVTIFHDLYIKNPNGKFTQIDLAVATKVGLIIFEVKDYSGWIYGTGYREKWTQVLTYGRNKYRFYNPVLQNKKHIEDIRKQSSQFQNLPFFSVIVFYGNSEFKDVSFIPKGTYLIKPHRIRRVLKTILNENPPAKYTNKNEVVGILKAAVENSNSTKTQTQHIKNIENMLGNHRIFE